MHRARQRSPEFGQSPASERKKKSETSGREWEKGVEDVCSSRALKSILGELEGSEQGAEAGRGVYLLARLASINGGAVVAGGGGRGHSWHSWHSGGASRGAGLRRLQRGLKRPVVALPRPRGGGRGRGIWQGGSTATLNLHTLASSMWWRVRGPWPLTEGWDCWSLLRDPVGADQLLPSA